MDPRLGVPQNCIGSSRCAVEQKCGSYDPGRLTYVRGVCLAGVVEEGAHVGLAERAWRSLNPTLRGGLAGHGVEILVGDVERSESTGCPQSFHGALEQSGQLIGWPIRIEIDRGRDTRRQSRHQ
jgi:hypothetical protein